MPARLPVPVMSSESPLFIGVMSGTSIDALDLALASFDDGVRCHRGLSVAMPADLRDELLALCHAGADEIERLGRADRRLARLAAEAVAQLLSESGRRAAEIRAIGSHGQTLRHRPELKEDAFTLQIGDPSALAELSGIPVVADFRRRDVAAGGQGAPLVCGFHRDVFAVKGRTRLILNVGGISNLTVLGADGGALGFDCGPGNVLLDSWCLSRRNETYDDGGAWAATGRVSEALLDILLEHPFLAMQPPRSTGREDFNMTWLEACLARCGEDAADADVQATLAEFTAAVAADCARRHGGADAELFVCGGGVRNDDLMRRLARRCEGMPVDDTRALGVEPKMVEAMAFAWLAYRHLRGEAGNVPEVTGAAGERVLGALYPA